MQRRKRGWALTAFSVGHFVLLGLTLAVLWWVYGERYSKELTIKNAPEEVALEALSIVEFHFDDRIEGLSAEERTDRSPTFIVSLPFSKERLQRAKKKWLLQVKKQEVKDE